jgi:glycerol-3-phosphate O-acyltransferase / dihydroxyacetone phosphate acyltransferase
MIYSFLKTISKLALKVYYRNIHIEGKENIPKKGPFLIVANHPSSFLDPINIATQVNHKISFLAKGVMFKNKIIASILRGLNMVPIHRAQDNPEMLTKNKEVFKACYQKLKDNGVIMIFPEGTSEMERRLRKIKTGAARIALGAEKEYNYSLNMKIVPVGLNYTKSSRFRSEVFVNFGVPINVQDYIESYKKDEITTSNNLTNRIEGDIKKLIVAIDKHEYDELIERLESFYNTELTKTDKLSDLKFTQEIANAVKHYQEKDPVLFDNMNSKIDTYYRKLKRIKLSDKNFNDSHKPQSDSVYKIISILLLGFPVWLLGFINNYLPYRLPRTIALLITKDESFYGALLMSLGTIIFVLFYSLEIFLMWHFSHHLLFTLGFGIILPIIGFFTIYYARIARRFYYNWLLIFKFNGKKKILLEVIKERAEIVADLEKIKTNYLSKN